MSDNTEPSRNNRVDPFDFKEAILSIIDEREAQLWKRASRDMPIFVGEPTATLRDQFALAALSGLLPSRTEMDGEGVSYSSLDENLIAQICYRISDAMMEARKPK